MSLLSRWSLTGWTVFLCLLSSVSGIQAQLNPAEVYRRTSDSVVLILASHGGAGHSKGTGSVIAPGRVLTNAHVVLDDQGRAPDRLRVYLRSDNLNDDSQRTYRKGRRAEILRSDLNLDLALLEVEGIDEVEPIPLADSREIQIGDPVLAIGHPENGGLWSLTSGRIGSVIRNHGGIEGRHVFQTEASLNRGNSGGPLLNQNGRLIGVNTSIARQSKDGLAITGINFSVQSNVAQGWLVRGGLQVAAVAPGIQQDTTAAGIRRKPAEKTELPQKPEKAPKMEGLEDNLLLTPPKPFKDEDLFQWALEGEEDELDRIMESELDSMDQKMDEAFDSF